MNATAFVDLAEWSLTQHVIRCAERGVPDDDTLTSALDSLRAQVVRAQTDRQYRAWLLDHMRAVYRDA